MGEMGEFDKIIEDEVEKDVNNKIDELIENLIQILKKMKNYTKQIFLLILVN